MMPEKDPTTFSIATYMWVLGLSMWGGWASWVRKRQKGIARPFNITELIGEAVVSSFSGILTFLICEATNTNKLLEMAFVGLAGHMGAKAILHLEYIFESKFPKSSTKKEEGGL